MAEYLVRVTQLVRVKLDESKFDGEFLREFRESFYPFDSVEDHARHLGQLVARGIYEASPYSAKEFIEGYGPIGEFGISASVDDVDTEIEAP